MRLSLRTFSMLIATSVASLAMLTAPALAQFGGGAGGGLGGGGGGLGGGGGGLGGGGGQQSAFSGVMVDASGVLHRNLAADPGGQLIQQRIRESLAQLDGDLKKPSKLRKVSLTRLERILKERIANGGAADGTMKSLAGLTRIDYVFCYPETKDIVLAGPAEPWATDPAGRQRGVETGRPVIELQDVVTALRAFPPSGKSKQQPLIYCSIDPTAEGLSRMQQFLQQFGRQATPRDTQFIVEQLRDRLGLQVVSVGGVPATTHFAQVLVEADYRMKLIGIGLEKPPVRLKSYVARANPAAVARNAMQRWYFMPDYECLRVSEDGLAMEVVGEGVKLVGEDEFVGRDGTRKSVGRSNRASNAFTATFTKMFPKLAEQSPVYAQLRNCIDLAVVAAFIQDRDLYGEVDWNMSLLGSEADFPVETYNAPQQVATAVNSMWKGNTLMTPIGGGVEIRPTLALEPANLLSDDEGEVSTKRSELAVPQLADDQWWWD